MRKIVPWLLLAAICLTACANTEYGVETPDAYVSLCAEIEVDVYYAGAFRKDDLTLAAAVDEEIAAMIDDGTAKQISENWFGEDFIVYETSAPLPSSDDDSLRTVQETGTLTVGYISDDYPMLFEDANANVQGFDADLLEEAARRLGLTVTYEKVSAENQETKLSDGQIDTIFGGLAVTEEKRDTLTLTRNYFKTSFSLLTLASQANDKQNLSDFAGQKIGACQGSAAYDYLLSQGFAAENITAYTSAAYGYYRLREKKVAALLVDTPFADWVQRGKMNTR
ncbi:MAG: transporter substrate-binding domain-containing protein [Clostridiales bacterium]|nr:transporter substrate-binding domain-containing protein [Clostridiales bacterium]